MTIGFNIIRLFNNFERKQIHWFHTVSGVDVLVVENNRIFIQLETKPLTNQRTNQALPFSVWNKISSIKLWTRKHLQIKKVTFYPFLNILFEPPDHPNETKLSQI